MAAVSVEKKEPEGSGGLHGGHHESQPESQFDSESELETESEPEPGGVPADLFGSLLSVGVPAGTCLGIPRCTHGLPVSVRMHPPGYWRWLWAPAAESA